VSEENGTGSGKDGTGSGKNGAEPVKNGTGPGKNGTEPVEEAGTETYPEDKSSEKGREAQLEKDSSRQEVSGTTSDVHLRGVAAEVERRQETEEDGGEENGPEQRASREPESSVCHICRALGLVPGAIF
jgi:hypothetical protein